MHLQPASALESNQYTFQSPRGPGNYHRPMSQKFYDMGLPANVALRHDLCSTKFIDHKLKGGGKHKENTNPCHEYCLCNNCAWLRSEQLIAHYKHAIGKVKGGYTFVETCDLETFPQVRKKLKLLKCPFLGNFMVWDKDGHRWLVRAVLMTPKVAIPQKLLEELRALDPHLRLERRHDASQFDMDLLLLFPPDLPNDADSRMRLKSSKRKIFFTGLSQVGRTKLSDKSSTTQSDSFLAGEAFCHLKDCIAHTIPYFAGTPEHEKSYCYHSPPAKAA